MPHQAFSRYTAQAALTGKSRCNSRSDAGTCRSIFCGRFLLGAKLRPANIDGAAGAVDEVARIVARIRARWPKVRIVLRGDSGFCREELMAWCEAEGVAYLFGLAPNARLKAVLAPEAWEAARLCRTTGKAAGESSRFNPRFVVNINFHSDTLACRMTAHPTYSGCGLQPDRHALR